MKTRNLCRCGTEWKRGFTLIELLVVVAIIALAFGAGYLIGRIFL